MRKTSFLVCTVLALLALIPQVTWAQYDFQAILDAFDNKLNDATDSTGTALWSAGSPPLWQSVVPYPVGSATWAQGSALFVNLDNTGNGIKDDAELAMLQRIVNGDACTRQLLGATKCDAIVTAFNNNRALIANKQMYLDLSIRGSGTDYTTVTVSYSGFTLSDKATHMARTRVTTGSSVTLPIIVDDPIIFKDETDVGAILGAVDIPSLWGEDGILNMGAAGLGDDLQTLLAAYMTIGDQGAVDYMTAVIEQTLVKGVLPNIVSVILAALGKESVLPESDAALPEAPKEEDSKLFICQRPVANIAIVNTTPQTILIDGGPDYVRINKLYATLYSGVASGETNPSGFITGCESWFSTYIIDGATTGGTFDSRQEWLAATGNLNGVNYTNVNSYTINASNQASYLEAEWVTYPALGFGVQPQSTGSAQTYGGTWNFGAAISYTPNATDIQAPTYQWQWNNSGTWTNITGATALNYNLPLDFVGTRQYHVIATPPTNCGSAVTSSSASVQVAAPVVTISQQPISKSAAYGTSVSFTCVAGPPTINYQWYNSSGAISGAASSTYTISSVTFANGAAGPYYCVCSLASYPAATATSSNVTLTVTAPPIVFTVQPVGASVQAGNNYSMTCTATIGLGNLTYRWYKGGVDTGVTGQTFNITSMDASKAGLYVCRVTSTAPSGEYTTFSSDSTTANVKLLGKAWRVDKNAPGPTRDGLTWATAYLTIQAGIDAALAGSGGEVWVAGGAAPGGNVYNELRTEAWGGPSPTGSVTGSLVLKSGVEVYGGFEGYLGMQETLNSQRGVRRSVTIIDGSQSATGATPASHVVVCGNQSGPITGAKIDGFTIRGGRSVLISGVYHAGRGAGLYNYQSQPVVENCTFTDNIAAVSGGAIANESVGANLAVASIVNCAFYSNTASRSQDSVSSAVCGGGAIFNNNADVNIRYCDIVNNTIGAGWEGPTPSDPDNPHAIGANSAGVYNWQSSPNVNSTVFWNNGGTTDPTDNMTTEFDPLIAAEAAVITNCLTDATDPLFVAAGPEFYLQATSPLIEAGDPSNPAPARDLPGSPRPQNSRVDIGAYEYVATAPNAICKDLTLTLDGSNNAVLYATDVNNASVIAGGVWKMQIQEGAGSFADLLTYNCSGVASHTINMRITDFQGGTGNCTSTVAVRDGAAPVAICKEATVVLDGAGSATLAASAVNNGSTDNCGSPTMTVSLDGLTFGATVAFTCANAGLSVPVTLRATDISGNTSTCITNVLVRDTTAPTAVCKSATVNVGAVTLPYTLPVSAVNNNSTDNCGAPVCTIPNTVLSCANIGSIISVTMTATDGVGNASTCTAQVSVVDTTPPTVTCKPFTLDLDGAGLGSIQASDVTNTATDQCGIATTVVSKTSFNNANLGLNTVTLTATDNGGATATCTASVTVRDLIPPTITLMTPTALTVKLPATYTDPGYTAFDNCGGNMTASVVVTGGPGTWPPTGTFPQVFTINYNLTDASGNTAAQQTRTLTVTTNDVPVITISGTNPQALNCAGGTYTVPSATAYDTEDGNLTSSVTWTNDVNTSLVGTYHVNYQVIDSQAATGTAQLVVNVTDTVKPTLTVNSGVATFNHRQGQAWVGPVKTATDTCCGDLTASITMAGDTITAATPAGTYHQTYNVVDCNANTATPFALTVNVTVNNAPVVTITGNNPLTIVCKGTYTEPTVTATDVEDGNLTVTPSWVPTTSPVNTNVPGTYTRRFCATDFDLIAPATTCKELTILVTDTVAPVITLTPATGPTIGRCGTYTLPTASANDACAGAITPTYNTSAVNVNAVGSYNVVYTAVDPSGNTATTNWTVTVVANPVPTLTLLGTTPLTLNCGSGAYTDAGCTSTDSQRQGDAPVTVTPTVTGLPISTTAPGGPYTVTYTYNDGCNSAVTASRVITVVDSTAPVITLNPATGPTIARCGTFTYPTNSAADACSGAITPTRTGSVTVNTVGSYPLTYTAVDGAGNTATATWTVTVLDNPAPTITLLGTTPLTLQCGSGAYTDAGVTATDSPMQGQPAVAVTPTVTGLPISTTSKGGPYTITYSYNDGCNPAAQVTRSVTVVDTTPPVMVINGGVSTYSYRIGDVYTPPTGTAVDSCTGNRTANIVVTGTVQTDTPGTYPLVFNVDDGQTPPNAAAPFTVDVIVSTNAAPILTINGPNPLNIVCKGAYSEPSVTAVDPDTSEDLTGEIIPSWVDGLAVDTNVPGTYTRRFCVTDHDPTNPATTCHDLTINVTDTVAPVITLNPATGPTIGRCGSYTLPTASANDACAGAITPSLDSSAVNVNAIGSYNVVYTAVDPTGNTATSNWTVTVVDNPVPELNLIGGATVSHTCGAAYVDAGVSASDSQRQGDAPVSVTPTVTGLGFLTSSVGGPYTITYTYDDGCNAPVVLTRTVNVVDSTIPTITISGPNPLQVMAGQTWPGPPSATSVDACCGPLSSPTVTDLDAFNRNVEGDYSFQYSSTDCNGNATSTNLLVQVRATLVYTDHPDGATVYSDAAPITLSATYANGNNATTYQWFNNGNPVTVSPLSTPNGTAGVVTCVVNPSTLGAGVYIYHVEIVDANGTWSSNDAGITVYDALQVGHIANLNATEAGPVSVTAVATGGNAPLAYQWYKDGSLLSDTANVTGTGTATLNIIAFDSVADEGAYWVVVTDQGAKVVESNHFTIQVSSGAPVAGGLGLAFLALIAGVSGVAATRRRK